MNLCFTAGKQSGIGTWHSTREHPKSTIVASIVYGSVVAISGILESSRRLCFHLHFCNLWTTGTRRHRANVLLLPWAHGTSSPFSFGTYVTVWQTIQIVRNRTTCCMFFSLQKHSVFVSLLVVQIWTWLNKPHIRNEVCQLKFIDSRTMFNC
jgi:hypothetical protein